jgi:hypothetical protein
LHSIMTYILGAHFINYFVVLSSDFKSFYLSFLSFNSKVPKGKYYVLLKIP